MAKAAYNDAEYKRNRKRALERDGYRCRMRGCHRHASQLPRGESDLTAQHVVPWRQGGGNDLDNLVTLCRWCHGAMDGGRRY